MMWRLLKKTAFYALVVAIVLESLFPFYYAILTSFKSGTSLFEVNYWPTMVSWDNYATIFESGSFPRNLLNSVVVTTLTVASALLLAVTAAYALSRVRFQGRSLLLLTILSVSMFPQMVVLAGLFEVIRFFGLFNSIWGLIFSYMIFTLPFTVWVLTTFHAGASGRDRGGRDRRRRICVDHRHARLHASNVARASDNRTARLHSRLERVPVRAHFYIFEPDANGAGGDRAAFGGEPVRDSLGHDHGSVGNRHLAARWVGSHLSTRDHIRPDRRRGQRVGRTVRQS